MFKHFNFIFPVFLLVTSCTTTLASRAPTNLENQINKSKNSIVKDDCDDLFFSRKIEIINALDEKNINCFVTNKNYIEKEFNIIPFGHITLREPTTPLVPYDNWSKYSL